MRERQALVAYEQPNSTYDVHRSDRLGRDLHDAWRITEVTPYGYSRREEESQLIEEFTSIKIVVFIDWNE